MKIYDLCVNEGLVGGIYRYRAARGGLNFKIYGVCFDALRGGRRKFYRGSVVVLVRQWRPLALYAQLWRLGGVSDADGFAALAAAEVVKIECNSCGGDSGDERR
ncbi:hypothetical protein [uncultured Campylobacter sp.]|uniref:hypothetical protein n=1 Tax=uncultured Campylobacter sp. TaxID=218934 RepID=UPI00260688BF|nr:hypothetical protein [uncultured Campylobacter sp.]